MTAFSIPPVVAADCADQLSRLAAELNRDAATLIRTATALLTTKQHGRPLGVLKKYAREHKQHGAAEVEKVIYAIQAVMDPEHVKHLERHQKKRDKSRAEFEKRRSEPCPAENWEMPVVREQAAKHLGGNVIAGPWDACGEARP